VTSKRCGEINPKEEPMADQQEGKKELPRKPGEDAEIEDLAKRRDQLAEEKDKEKDPAGGGFRIPR